MAFVKEKYSQSRIDLIYELLKKESDGGTPKDYDIKVDELKVVSKTSDPERFYDHEQFVLPESKNITITIHDNKAHRSLKYILLLVEEEASQQELSGIEKSINSKMLFERKKWEYDQLRKDYDALKERLRESEEYADQLKDQIDDLEIEKSKSSGNLTNTVMNLAGVYLTQNPNALNGIPIIGSLFGNKNNKSLPPGGSMDGVNAHCNCKETPRQFTGAVYESDKLKLDNALTPYFKTDYIARVSKIINYLFYYNSFIDQTIKVIEHAIENGPQKDENKSQGENNTNVKETI